MYCITMLYVLPCSILLSFNNKQKYTPHPNVAHEESLNRCRKLRVFVLMKGNWTDPPGLHSPC